MTQTAIVMGVSRSASSSDALAWAAAEAHDRCCTLRIVHAVRWPPLAMATYGVLPVDLVAESLSAGELFLEAAKNLALSIAPYLRIDTALELGDPASAILRPHGDETMIVLGQRPHCRLSSLLYSSTVGQVAHRARCPVAVVGLHASSPIRRRHASSRSWTAGSRRSRRWTSRSTQPTAEALA